MASEGIPGGGGVRCPSRAAALPAWHARCDLGEHPDRHPTDLNFHAAPSYSERAPAPTPEEVVRPHMLNSPLPWPYAPTTNTDTAELAPACTNSLRRLRTTPGSALGGIRSPSPQSPPLSSPVWISSDDESTPPSSPISRIQHKRHRAEVQKDPAHLEEYQAKARAPAGRLVTSLTHTR
ncbi:hypothetical protein B0H10DRAFT_2213223 [Mycena sp. CBHHK59/15]|nr:hypothetical protein B0H10DRAFT_2213223 [Mycena sp. CBHHK59/15]